MCGICGVLDLDGQPVDEAVGQRMTELLWHRGPDGRDQLIRQPVVPGRDPSIFLGHTRLKIIDLSEAARQPLPNEDDTVWVIFNGEIYNFQVLRQELQQRGHRFRSRSDTETIVHAYEEYGEECVARLDGMFAFALWDDRCGRLLLARDRTGKKPLFYAFDGQRLTFASEIKAILAAPWVERRIAVEHLPALLTFGYVPTPGTMYRGIRQVPPASYITVDRSGLKGPYRYWRLTFAPAANGQHPAPEEASRQVRRLLTDAVRRRLISDVPLGALLSGGLDSSIVVGLMSRLLPEPVRTFTIGLADDRSFDERPYAALAAHHFKTDHTEFVVNADAMALMDLLLWHHDQPFGDSSAIPTYLVSKLARQQVTVVLNGDGGDEVFAGYDRFRGALVADRLPGWLSPVGRMLARWLPRDQGYYSLGRRLERFFEGTDVSPEARYLGWVTYCTRAHLAALLQPELAAQLDVAPTQAWLDGCLADMRELPLLHRLLHLNFTTYLPDDLHVKMDRVSMANALETRSPMLDTALIEFVTGLPPALKIRRCATKYVLRLAFRDLLPPTLLQRRKHGFGVPLGHWFRYQLRAYVEELLLTPRARLRSYLNQDTVRTFFQEHIDGIRPHWERLWLLLTFELWLRMLEDGALWTPRRTAIEDAIDITAVTRQSYA